MIGKVTRGADVGGLLRYLYGPGRANEHTNPHLVAAWLGDEPVTLAALEPSPGRARHRFALLADQLTLPIELDPAHPDKYVWQCSMRTADTDRRLNDQEWAQVAQQVMETTGFAPAADPGGCRWVAVRHADDHIHIVATLTRQDGGRVDTYRDWSKVHAAARTVEARFGLTTVPSPDRSHRVAPTRAEVEKARRGPRRHPRQEPARVYLTREIRHAAAASASRAEFEHLLRRERDIVIGWRYSQRDPGQITGYRVGRLGDLDAAGRQVWFSGSKLSPDLSLPKLHARWAETSSPTGDREQLWRRSAVLSREAATTPGAAPGVSVAESATVFARLVEGRAGGPLTDAAERLADAARQPHGVRPPCRAAHPLQHLATTLAALDRAEPSDLQRAAMVAVHLTGIITSLHGRNAPSLIVRTPRIDPRRRPQIRRPAPTYRPPNPHRGRSR